MWLAVAGCPEASLGTDKNQELWLFLQSPETLAVLEEEGMGKTFFADHRRGSITLEQDEAAPSALILVL